MHSGRAVAVATAMLIVFAAGAPTAGAAIPMQLPFPVGEVWQANGPHPFNGSTGVRNSVDMGRTNATTGTVVAAAAGTVTLVQDCGGGYEIRIAHADGWETGYYHLSAASVAQGASVSMGQAIGATGEGCGAANFKHVQFSLRHDGSDVDIDGLDIGGHTLHSTSYNFGGFWTRNSDGATVASGSIADARCCLTSLAVDGTAIPERSFVRTPDEKLYRIAGGAPIHVSSWDSFGGPQPVTDVSFAQLTALRSVPADGTFISTNQDGAVYRVAGGAPIHVPTWDAYGGPQPTVGIDKWAIDNITNPAAHLRAVPADGTFLSTKQDGAVYRVAGGAPLSITWDIFVGPQPTVAIDRWALDNLTNPAAHLRAIPSNGTLLRGLPSGHLWHIEDGHRSATTATAGAVSVNDATAESFPLAPCPVGQTGTPPNCVTPAPPCAAGQIGMPPNCATPPPAGDAPQQPAAPTTPLTPPVANSGRPSSPRTIRRTIVLRRGCSRAQLKVSGKGVAITFVKRMPRSRCRLTLRVSPGATGRRDVLVKRGQRTTRMRGAIRL
jgi:murein DD-endopeptidase MepM/ murein hydrolase activator NlpD